MEFNFIIKIGIHYIYNNNMKTISRIIKMHCNFGVPIFIYYDNDLVYL